MTGQQNRHSLFPVQFFQKMSQFLYPHRVQSIERFVQYQKFRFSQESNRQPQPLAHPQREFSGRFATSVFQTHQLQGGSNIRLI